MGSVKGRRSRPKKKKKKRKKKKKKKKQSGTYTMKTYRKPNEQLFSQ